ncbi:TPA: helix-turn-helix transcriptional regulator [Escherichia coli]|uniref:helix-turn-helix transcriptional regulator n=1 Tax=Escherichia coli TaxID=562 RepID=UPI0010ACC60A|nr:helix-turn-helix transcriptional regulator [Escherichia coli]TJF20751.1 AraC family transcriptional regulator [Escherichia coli]
MRELVTNVTTSMVEASLFYGVATSWHMLLYTKNCNCLILRGESEEVIAKGCILYICPGVRLRVIPFSVHNSYEILILNTNVISGITNFFLNSTTKELLYELSKKRDYNDFFMFPLVDGNLELYRNACSSSNSVQTVLRLCLLFSKSDNFHSLLATLMLLSEETISDKVRKIVEKNIQFKWKLCDVAHLMRLSENSLRNKMKQEGVLFNDILMNVRMKKAYSLLIGGRYSLIQTANLVGISSLSYFIKSFKNHYGVTPKRLVTESRHKIMN